MNSFHIERMPVIAYPPPDTVGYQEGIWIYGDIEEVEWHIANKDGKRVVYGYSIIEKLPPDQDLRYD